MPSPEVSVVIPVAGGRINNLHNALLGLAHQTFQDFEVIVVNDGGEDEYIDPVNSLPHLDIRYIKTQRFQKGRDRPPRNKGAMLARAPFVVFIDSDIILDHRALAYYVDDFRSNPKGAVAGLYDWLPPCEITPALIEKGLDAIYDTAPNDDPAIKLRIDWLPWPKGKQTHSVRRDMREPMFMTTEPGKVHTGAEHSDGGAHKNVFLGMFSGNLGFNLANFKASGGYWEDLSAGLVDDGALGLTFWALSSLRDESGNLVYDGDGNLTPRPEFGVRLDPRIRGAHQYHDRNTSWVAQQSAKEVDLIDRRFRLNKYADGRPPVLPRPVYPLI